MQRGERMSTDLSRVATSNRDTAAAPAPQGGVGAVAAWADDRLGLATVARKNLRKVFPDHWSFMLGEIALWSFVVLLLTGVFLTLWFNPSMSESTYQGTYTQLRGVPMSDAYASTLHISFDVRGGLLVRQMHHWAAMIFVGAMMVHLMRVAFTGAFRKPRELNWVIGSILLLLGTIEGFTGYSLPDDLLSGTGLRAADGFLKATPVVGTYMSFFLFGGEFPGDAIIPRLYMAHVLLIPGLLLALIGAHMLLLVFHKHTQWPGPGRTEQNVVGYPMLPVYMAKAGGFFFMVFGVTALMGGAAVDQPGLEVRPLRPDQGDGRLAARLVHGLARRRPADHAQLGVARLRPPDLVEHPDPDPGAAGPDVHGGHAAAVRRGVGQRRQARAPPAPASARRPDPDGVPGVADDGLRAVLGGRRQRHHRHPPPHEPELDHLLHARTAVFVVPPLVFLVVRRWCIGLQRADNERLLHGYETGIIMRSPDGGYTERHQPVSDEEAYTLASRERDRVLVAAGGIDDNGVAAWVARAACAGADLARRLRRPGAAADRRGDRRGTAPCRGRAPRRWAPAATTPTTTDALGSRHERAGHR